MWTFFNNKIYTNKELNKQVLKKINKRLYKKKINLGSIFVLLLKLFFIVFVFCSSFLFLFFKTNLLLYYKDMWVTTAMATAHHKYLATWFLDNSEIQEIMDRNKLITEDFNNLDLINLNDLNNYLNQPLVVIEEIKRSTFQGYIVKIKDPSKVKLVNGVFGKTGTQLKDLMLRYNAVFGTNAGGFGDANGHGKGNIPVECIISDGIIMYGKNDIIYNIVGFNRDNKLVLGKYNLEQALDLNIRDAVGFTPFLIVDGDPQIKKGNGGWGIQPRTCIGQTKQGEVLFLIIDGRQAHSIGATLKDCMDILLEYGAFNAANLDGGSTTVAYDKYKRINKPSTPSVYGERWLPSAFLVFDENSNWDKLLEDINKYKM